MDATRARTALQEAFAIEYMIDRNALAAYTRAKGGTVGKSAKSVAWELFHLPQVQARIAELSAEHLGDAKRRKDIRIGALMRTGLDPAVKTSDRLRALELSGKIDGDFVEKHEVTLLNQGRAGRLQRARQRTASTLPAAPAVTS